jgi:hypothetical protein
MVRLPARVHVVTAQDVHAARHMTQEVAADDDAFNRGPRRAAALIARRQQDGIAGLIGHPEVFHDVAFDDDVARVLQLEEILDGPARRLGRRGRAPA